MKTPAEEQIEALLNLKSGRGTAPDAPRKAAPAREARVLRVDARTWGQLEQRRKAEFKDSRSLAAWAARLVLALPAGAASLSPEEHAELFERMRQWAREKGLHGSGGGEPKASDARPGRQEKT